jgi:hypothetical protein
VRIVEIDGRFFTELTLAGHPLDVCCGEGHEAHEEAASCAGAAIVLRLILNYRREAGLG